MAESLKVEPDRSSDIPVITISYGREQMLQTKGDEISNDLVEAYQSLSKEKNNPSLIVEIKADTAGSPLLKGLHGVYRAVTAKKGQLICVGYPNDYLQPLQSLGFLDMPGFSLLWGREEAIERLKNAASRK
jgi:hypothetical protein